MHPIMALVTAYLEDERDSIGAELEENIRAESEREWEHVKSPEGEVSGEDARRRNHDLREELWQ